MNLTLEVVMIYKNISVLLGYRELLRVIIMIIALINDLKISLENANIRDEIYIYCYWLR